LVLHGTYFFRIRPDYRLEYLRHEYDYCKTLFLIYSGASAVYFVTNFETIKSNKLFGGIFLIIAIILGFQASWYLRRFYTYYKLNKNYIKG